MCGERGKEKERGKGEEKGGGGRAAEANAGMRASADPSVECEVCYVDLIITSFEYGGEAYYSAVFRDVTQDKVYREKDTLLAFLSHEIRNPVQAITLGCQLLLQSSRNSATTHIAKDLYLAADLLHSVVTDTIDYVQISTRNFQPKLEVRENEMLSMKEMKEKCLRYRKKLWRKDKRVKIF